MKLFLPRVAALVLTLALFAGCTTRSISNSGYDHEYARSGSRGNDTTYRGELSELDVVGVSTDAAITDSDIRSALAESGATRLTPSSRVLLIQSGAEFPDDDMMTGLSLRYQVQPFSGIPQNPQGKAQLTFGTAPKEPVDAASYSKALRLAAARGGYDKIVCYWGVLESERESKATKLISWVPIAGNWLPDEKQSMRIRLRAVVVDVASGRWTYVAPESVTSKSLSSYLTRRDTDQSLVAELKAAGYRKLVAALAENRNG